jgi:mannosyltransferase
VVPTLALIVLSLEMTPVFSPRYLAFSAPAAAILMAVAVSALPRRWLRVVAVLACVALTAPGYVAQRLPEAKQESSWSEVADLIAAERALEREGTGEAIIYGPVRQHPSATTRVIAYSYPDAFAGLVDVKLNTPAAETGQLWETRYPLADVTDRFTGMDTVWLVTSNKQDWRPSVTAKLTDLGYHLDTEWNLTRVNVLRFEK